MPKPPIRDAYKQLHAKLKETSGNVVAVGERNNTIVVFLRREPSAKNNYPKTFKGYKVTLETIGIVKAKAEKKK